VLLVGVRKGLHLGELSQQREGQVDCPKEIS
jgi:hypothetical protein